MLPGKSTLLENLLNAPSIPGKLAIEPDTIVRAVDGEFGGV